MKLSDELKRRFVKDYKLPVPVVQDPYFQHFLELSEEHYSGMTAYRLLVAEVQRQGGEKEFSEWKYSLVKKLLADMTGTPEWEAFTFQDPTKNLSKLPDNRQNTLYQEKNANGAFLSLDLREANFESLKHMSNDYVLGSESFRDLLSRYTDSPYLLNSKPFRQFVLVSNALLPQRQARMQKHLVAEAYKRLMELGVSDPVFYNQDEMVFKYSATDHHLLELFVEESSELNGVDFRLEKFVLEMVHPTKSMFAKRYYSGKLELKNVDKSFVPEVLRELKGEYSDPMDRAFMYEGRVARYEEPLYPKELAFNNL